MGKFEQRFFALGKCWTKSGMRTRGLFVILMALVPLVAFGRLVKIIDPKTLMADSKLVFIGKVRSVKASGIATHLSYPPLERTSFPWLTTEMEVLTPFKGVRKGDVVRVMMLSIAKSEKAEFMYSPPEVLEPDTGDIFFVCLGPTPMTNAFAALTGPYDENLSVFPLYRSHSTSRDSTRDEGKQLLADDKRFTLIWSLVNEAGEIVPDAVAKLRQSYAAEIRKAPKNDTVYLEWQTYTNAHGWCSDVPKGFGPTNSHVQNSTNF